MDTSRVGSIVDGIDVVTAIVANCEATRFSFQLDPQLPLAGFRVFTDCLSKSNQVFSSGPSSNFDKFLFLKYLFLPKWTCLFLYLPQAHF